jgi:hypothetical protein
MADESRLGRETIDTAYVLKQIVQAGVRVFFYLDDRERTLDSPMDEVMLAVTTFADELKRVMDDQMVYDKAAAKARQGYVVGAVVFGYDNQAVLGPSGKRSHVIRVINEPQAAVVRRVFSISAAGTGFARLAKMLNAEGAPAPRPKRGRAPGWSASTVRVILNRRLYLGEATWGCRKKRDTWGQAKPSRRPEAEWIRTPAPAIITEAEWTAPHQRPDGVRTRLQATGAAVGNRRARDTESAYLLSGFARCDVCGSALWVLSGGRAREHHRVYGCTRYHKTGLCPNGLRVDMNRVDIAVLNAIADEVLGEHVVKAVVDRVLAALAPNAVSRDVDDMRGSLQAVEREIGNRTRAIAKGGELESLLDELRDCEKRRHDLREAISAPRTCSGSAD